MTIADIIQAALEILALADNYRHDPRATREMRMDPLVLAYFQGRFGSMARQHHVRVHRGNRSKRIDFRHGTHNPVVIELAVRPRYGAGEMYGSQNSPELRKLCRVVPSQARTRVLLLLDLKRSPIDKVNLKATYDSLHAGRGRFTRHGVRVVYVHKERQYHFLWNPRAQ